MNFTILIVWSLAALISAMLYVWVMKTQKRRVDSHTAIYKILVVLIFMIVGAVLTFFLHESAHFPWVVRCSVLVLGILQAIVMYTRPWTIRDKFNYAKDSFLPEFLFTLLTAFIGAAAFESSGKLLRYADHSIKSTLIFWDLPALIVLPFLMMKLMDLISQVPYKVVENLWLYPIEPFSHEGRPWNNLMQVNFELAKSLKDEYNLLSFKSKPWVQAPQEYALGEVFRLLVQDRRLRVNLSVIQDLGDEYAGGAQFWWLFSIKVIWWNPSTWFRRLRYLNPSKSIASNNIRKYDVVLAKRIPIEGIEIPQVQDAGQDLDKTVLINR
jgi:hypothetical protein